MSALVAKRDRLPNVIAGIAQLVEHNLAKVGVASSSLVSRSKFDLKKTFGPEYRGFLFSATAMKSENWVSRMTLKEASASLND